MPYIDGVYVEDIAAARGWALVDIYDLTGFIGTDPFGVTSDLIHPNDGGKLLVADAVTRAIT